MAINKNHEFGDLDGVKCSIVEKDISTERVEFLKKILEYNNYTVVVLKSPPPKAAPAKPAVPAAEDSANKEEPSTPAPPTPETFTLGVTDLMFNAINAIFGRQLRTATGHIVTQAYWYQREMEPNDEIPYYEKKV